MANHCWNYVVFHNNPEGTKKLHTRLVYLKEQQLREEYTNKGLDIPEYLKSINSVSLYALLYPQVFNQRWKDGDDVYDKFGSKWFECNWDFEKDGDLVMSGDSAWSPMLPFFQKICKHFKLEAYGNYEESGMDFAGEFQMNETGIPEHTQMSYREYQAINNPEIFWQDIIYQIEEGYFNSLEDIFAEFSSVNTQLTDKEKEELKEEFKRYQESVKNETK